MASSSKSKSPKKHGLGKRHRKVLRDTILGIANPTIRRMARRAGIKRISGLLYDKCRRMLKEFLSDIVSDAMTYMEHASRRTMSVMDVIYALKRKGKMLYGFGP